MLLYICVLTAASCAAYLAWRGGRGSAAAYMAAALSLSGVIYALQPNGLSLLYLFLAPGLAAFLCLRPATGGGPASRGGPPPSLQGLPGMVLPLVAAFVSLAFVILLGNVEPALVPSLPVSFSVLLEKRGHLLELVGVMALMLAAVYRLSDEEGAR